MADKILRQEEHAKSPQWLLIETFGELDGNYTIVDWGGHPKEFLPLDKAVKGAAAKIRQAITLVARSHEPLSANGAGRQVEVYPHLVGDRLHAVQVWAGTEEQTVPPRPRAGAWDINLTTLTALGSAEWAELADIPEEQRGHERSLANMFAQVQTDAKELVAMKRIIAAVPGTTHQGIWTVYRRDGAAFRSHFSCRIYEQQIAGTAQRIARGISQEVFAGPDGQPEPLILLEHRLLEADTPPGEYRALINLRNLRLIRWVHGSPIPDEIAWRGIADQPAPEVHPDDHPIMLDMARGLARSSTTGRLRMRGVDGSWIPINAHASLVAIDQETTAALLKFTIDR
ncbi:GAF domain-containing protein [Nocardia sp. CDC160]|uniref:GAF domain-containing protein n=1 Tax=Nocardia sp. CDC160 TaxID=3112166 RepID=UPI002DB6D42A|nr:GAF domain-containing protein [Nocardia sp. CDC160]MEC3919293.1 GAF domain-containing protein [Nocardia sp. CDC160]